MNHVYVTRHAWLDSAQQSHSQSNRQFAAASAQTTEARCDDEGQSVDDRQRPEPGQASGQATQDTASAAREQGSIQIVIHSGLLGQPS